MTMIDQPVPVADPPLPLLVTGVAGVAGFNAFHYFRERYPGQVFGTRRADNWPLSGAGIHGCDVEDQEGFAALFERYQFQSVLNCEGTCKLKSCELDPAMAQRVNVVGARNLLKLVRQYQARMVHLSIDLVFSGKGQGGHVEQDATDPVTVYGRTMVEAEQLVVQENPAACILRISLPMGISHNGHAGAIDWIQSRFMKSKPATLYYDEIRTPTYTDCLNRLFQRVLVDDLRGLYHAGGPRCLSLYEIAQVVNRIGGYAPEHLQGCYRKEAGPLPPRAGDVTMNSDKLATAIGFQPFDPWPYDESHVPTHRDWHRDRPGNEAGSPEWLAQVLYRNPRHQ
ncbi:MAG: sugar nucleotide-binding protein [Pirellulaceae bacterium]